MAADPASGSHPCPFFIVPIIGVIAASFVQSDGFGGIIPSFTLDNYKSVLTSQLTLQLYWATLKFAYSPGSSPC